MFLPDDSELFLNRRTNPRVDYRYAVRFLPDPMRPLRLSHGLTQNLSPKGVQLLTPVLLERRRSFPIWIPIDQEMIIRAEAKTMWMEVEDALGDSPYWVRSGLALTLSSPKDRTLLLQSLSKRTKRDEILIEQPASKIGFVF